jgi:hypothetical protein
MISHGPFLCEKNSHSFVCIALFLLEVYWRYSEFTGLMKEGLMDYNHILL